MERRVIWEFFILKKSLIFDSLSPFLLGEKFSFLLGEKFSETIFEQKNFIFF